MVVVVRMAAASDEGGPVSAINPLFGLILEALPNAPY